MKRAKVINFWAGPGAGKSTTAAGLFFLMKTRGFKVELVTEYAKELAYAGLLGDRHYGNPFAMNEEQHLRQSRLYLQVDYIVTDSPLLKDVAYAHHMLKDAASRAEFAKVAERRYDSYDNFGVWVERVKPYETYGRRESEESARDMDAKLFEVARGRIHYFVPGSAEAPELVLNALISHMEA